MTVFVIHEVVSNGSPVYDTTAAEEFGERRVLVRTSGRSTMIVNRRGHVEHRSRIGHDLNHDANFIEEAVNAIRDGLADYTRDDYLLMIGAPKLIAAASAIAAHRSGGHLKILVWEEKSGGYKPVVLGDLWSDEDKEAA